MMLSEMEAKENTIPVGHGGPIVGDAVWLGVPGEGISPQCVMNDEKAQALLWGKQHQSLAEHVNYVSQQAKIRRH
jgi:hypothetical protein